MLLFVPAGTLQYWQAWVYLAVLFLPLTLYGFVLLLKDPEMLERRMRMRESRAAQRKAIAGISILLLVIFILPGFDKRFGWSAVPPALVYGADLLILLGYLLFALTVRENRFTSRSVEVQQGQQVISSGPYALVRHPMYLATTMMFLFSPLALGSYWGMIASVLFPVLLVPRILDEEKMLRESLSGYEAYTRKVRYRLIPFVW
jgi:protein-S-isoprenylcysteine O-methyltransferase Ste14